MKIENFEALKKRCEELTLCWFRKWREEEPKEEPKPESEKAAKIAKIINQSDFGCQKNNVANLVSVIIGEKIYLEGNKKELSAKPRFLPISGILCLINENPNNHSYPLATPLLRSKDSGAVYFGNNIIKQGNNLPAYTGYYPPTKQEFNDFFMMLETTKELPEGFPIEEIIED